MVEMLLSTEGTAVPRDVAHRKGIPHFCVHLFITYRDHVYLQRRSGHVSRNPGVITSSVSGHVNASEKSDDVELLGVTVAVREAKEELGVTLRKADIRYVGQVDAISRGNGELCRCRTLVYYLDQKISTNVHTREVDALLKVPIQSVNSLLHTDGTVADNFPPIWEFFAARYLSNR